MPLMEAFSPFVFKVIIHMYILIASLTMLKPLTLWITTVENS